MITFKKLGTKRYGDIGNSLFQYALLRLVAEKCGLDYGTYQWGGRWWFQDVEKDKYAVPTKHVFEDVRGYRPESHLYRPEIWDVEDFTDLMGFFQSYKYYEPHRQRIKEIYTLSKKYQTLVDNIVSRWPKASRHIGLQYRFADEYAQTFPIIGHEYYKAALEEIKNRLGDCPDAHYVVSADMPYEQLGIDYLPPEQVSFVRTDPAVTMFAMTYCDQFIMANSTFSWWTAFLNRGENPFILCPENYMGINFCYPHEAYPQQWQTVPVTMYKNTGGFYRQWKTQQSKS